MSSVAATDLSLFKDTYFRTLSKAPQYVNMSLSPPPPYPLNRVDVEKLWVKKNLNLAWTGIGLAGSIITSPSSSVRSSLVRYSSSGVVLFLLGPLTPAHLK